MKAQEIHRFVRPLAVGVLATLLFSLLLTAIAASLAGRGILPISVVPILVITSVSALLGGILCGTTAETARLPLCLAAGAAYLLLVFLLRGLFFHTVGPDPWRIPLCVIPSAAVGAILTNGKKRR